MIGNVTTRVRKTEEDILESDLMKHNGILHTLKVKLENLKSLVDENKKTSAELAEGTR